MSSPQRLPARRRPAEPRYPCPQASGPNDARGPPIAASSGSLPVRPNEGRPAPKLSRDVNTSSRLKKRSSARHSLPAVENALRAGAAGLCEGRVCPAPEPARERPFSSNPLGAGFRRLQESGRMSPACDRRRARPRPPDRSSFSVASSCGLLEGARANTHITICPNGCGNSHQHAKGPVDKFRVNGDGGGRAGCPPGSRGFDDGRVCSTRRSDTPGKALAISRQLEHIAGAAHGCSCPSPAGRELLGIMMMAYSSAVAPRFKAAPLRVCVASASKACQATVMRSAGAPRPYNPKIGRMPRVAGQSTCTSARQARAEKSQK